jgi:hypothetical protein
MASAFVESSDGFLGVGPFSDRGNTIPDYFSIDNRSLSLEAGPNGERILGIKNDFATHHLFSKRLEIYVHFETLFARLKVPAAGHILWRLS